MADADASCSSLQQRRIEFHLARKPISSLPNNSTNSGFKLETLNPSSSMNSNRHSSNPPLPFPKKSDSSEFLDAAFDLDLGFQIPFRRIGAGLENLGNTCFLNSVLQCLTYTEPLVAYLLSGKHQNNCHIAGFCALCAMQKHVNRALQSTGRILAPKDLVSNLRCISRTFRNARQEDAHEYMIHLLESMHKCCLPSGVPAESPGAYDRSLVHKIFGGSLRSQVKCLQCSHCSNTFDPFLDLSLEITKADSVTKALMNFTAPEQLDGGERMYKCERCKQKVRALKQLTVYKAPYVLTVHLKRFRHFVGEKIQKKVQFGSSLNLKPFVSGAYEGDLTYTLYGVLVHAGGSTHSGHYYCYVRTSSGLWYSLDDNRVYQVSEKTVMEQKAYMLFYVRDRKNFGPKKSVSVHKENLITTMQKASSSSSIPAVKSSEIGDVDKNLKRAVSSGLVGKHSEGHNASNVLVQQNSSNLVASNNIALKKELNQNSNHVISSESNSLKKENSLLANTDLNEAVPSNKCSNGAHSGKIAHVTSAASCNKNKEKELVSIGKPSVSDCPSAANDCHLVSPTVALKNTSNNKSDVKLRTVVPLDSATQLTMVENSITKDEVLEPTSDAHPIICKPEMKRPIMSGTCTIKSSENTPRPKLATQMLQFSIPVSRLSTKILYGASVGMSMRKKFKRIKRSKIVLQNQADMGPSTSNSDSVFNFKHSRKNGHNSRVREDKGPSKMDSIVQFSDSNDELKHRSTSSQTVLASFTMSEETNALSLGENCKDAKDFCSKESNPELDNGVSEASTTGLMESIVGRWEGTASPFREQEMDDPNPISIGHVLDEWDEEYDRGKRKKIRGCKYSFGGPNVFQEVATKKAKSKRRKK
ncbi:unnamed protein product [Amaranthus hypochondriacus]